MQRKRIIPRRKREKGVVILLVAIVLLFVVAAMAALAIDMVTFYTARSEAQLAADGAALAGARVLANSGATSNPALSDDAKTLAQTVATQVAMQNQVGGRKLKRAEVLPPVVSGLASNPRITVTITRNDLPAFFSRIWGRTQFTVKVTAAAEAYNPSGLASSVVNGPPVAPICVKPWLLPNRDPTSTTPQPIFNGAGGIIDPGLVGQSWPTAGGANPNPIGLIANCGDCSPGAGGVPPLASGKYYPAAIDALDPEGFPPPAQSLPVCSNGFAQPYQLAIAGCVPTPITCGSTAMYKIDTSAYGPNRDTDTVAAVNCLAHSANGLGDKIDLAASPSPPPFQFLAGQDNPIVGARGSDILVSDSLVTIPVFDTTSDPPVSPVKVIGFLQVFLNSQGTAIPGTDIRATIVNMAGCGPTATGTPVLGNGGSPVPVRLVAP